MFNLLPNYVSKTKQIKYKNVYNLVLHNILNSFIMTPITRTVFLKLKDNIISYYKPLDVVFTYVDSSVTKGHLK